MPREISTHVWVSALLRRAQAGGAFATIVHRGDADRGDVLVKVTAGRDRCCVYAPAFAMEGPSAFERLPGGEDTATEADVDAIVAKRLKADRDLWVVEIEDREMRHFLTEEVRGSGLAGEPPRQQFPGGDMTYVRTVEAFNTATESENRIHDDATASRFGFVGGLVPGVDVFAYMAHAPAKLWGPDWLKRGGMRARFVKPVYDGQMANLTAEAAQPDRLALTLSSHGVPCGDGEAVRVAPAGEIETPPAAVQPDEAARPRASRDSLKVGQVLGYDAEPYTRALGLDHLAAVREDAALFEDGRIASPAYMLRRANYILAANVLLGPWIHSESDIRLHGLLRDGQMLETRARVADNFERKGHLIVALDFVCLADGIKAMSGRHWAIYEPRQVRAT